MASTGGPQLTAGVDGRPTPLVLHRMRPRLSTFFSSSLSAAFQPLPHTRTLRMAPPVVGSPFRVALVQLGGTTDIKVDNLKRAQTAIATAALGGGGPKPDLIVLPVRPCRPHALARETS